jgi:hypothetical protein
LTSKNPWSFLLYSLFNKIRDKGKIVSAGYRGGGGEREWVGAGERNDPNIVCTNSSQGPASKKNPSEKRADVVTQGVGSEFKTSTEKKLKKKRKTEINESVTYTSNGSEECLK